MSNNYTVLHCHTMLSNGTTNIDSTTGYSDYVKRASELGMKALAFSEHGSVFMWLKKKEAVEKAGMKYIHACEFYITETFDVQINDNYHCLLIARNKDGFEELNTLVSKAFNRAEVHNVDDVSRFYYRPRISFDDLINTSENIIITTACLASILNKAPDDLREKFIVFLSQNKERCFLEIQHHNVEDQKEYNRYLYNLSKTIGVRLVAGTDTHEIDEAHIKGREILQAAKGVHFDNEEGMDLTFKSFVELDKAYEIQNALPRNVYMDAIETTNVVADMVEEFTIDRNYKYPHLWGDPEKTIREKIKSGIIKKGVDKYPNYQDYLDRIEHEMSSYIHNGALDFMLLMEDVTTWCRNNGIDIGYGRGSVNGSIIAWLLGITEMDSIKWGLNFDRFMNVERVSLADIDTDFPPSDIPRVKDYIYQKHGLYCSDIITFNTIADKGAIRDVCRGLYKKSKPDTYMQITDEISNAFGTKDEKKTREKYPEVFEYVSILKGVVVSIGVHPCGLICSPEPLYGTIGLCTSSTNNYPISQLYMKEIDSLNYVKLDLLKLDTIELINETCKFAGIERCTPDNLDFSDIDVWNSMRDDTTAIFEWEGQTGKDYLKRLLADTTIKKFEKASPDVDRLMLLTIGNSAIRPAGASYRDDLANGVVRSTGSKPIDDFLSNTFGYLVFQCQIIDFLHEYCGFTMGEADVVRRMFSKKLGTDTAIPVIKDGGYLNGNESHYIDGYIKTMAEKYGIPTEKSEQDITAFIKVIEDASEYLFSLNHSQPYSAEGYACGWLRYYYPLEFLTVSLNLNKDNIDKTMALTAYAKKVGIKILQPRFGHSRSGYYFDRDTNCIYKGLSSVKTLGNSVYDEISILYGREYGSFIDLLIDAKNKSSIGAKIETLIKLNFFEEFGDRGSLLLAYERFNQFYGKGSVKKDKLSELNIDPAVLSMYSRKETETRAEEIDVIKYVMDTMGGNPAASRMLGNCIKRRRDKNTGEMVFNGYSTKKAVKEFNITKEDQFKYATHVVVGAYSEIDTEGLLRYLYCHEHAKPVSVRQIMDWEMEYYGGLHYVDPNVDKRIVYVQSLDTRYSPKLIAYSIATGKTAELKVHKAKRGWEKITTFKEIPFAEKDILYMESCGKENKKRKINDKWQNVPGEYEWWLNRYRKMEDL